MFDRFAKSKGFDDIDEYINDQFDQGNEDVMDELEMLNNELDLLDKELNDKGF